MVPILHFFFLTLSLMTLSFQHSNTFLYADDAKISKIIKQHKDCTKLLMDLVNIDKYCASNELFLNQCRCLLALTK